MEWQTIVRGRLKEVRMGLNKNFSRPMAINKTQDGRGGTGGYNARMGKEREV